MDGRQEWKAGVITCPYQFYPMIPDVRSGQKTQDAFPAVRQCGILTCFVAAVPLVLVKRT